MATAAVSIITVIACGLIVHTSASKCYSIFGLSTCRSSVADIDLDHPFTPAWWVANVHARADEIRNAKHILERTPIWALVLSFPSLDEVTEMTDNGMFDRAFRQALDEFARRGEVVEVLTDPEVTYGDLYKSFKAHPDEVLGIIDMMLDERAWDADVHDLFSRRRQLIKTAARVFAYLPTDMFTQYVGLLDRNALTTGAAKPGVQLPKLPASVDVISSLY